MMRRSLCQSSFAALAGIVVSYAAFYLLGWPLLTEAIAEWIMAETPSAWAVPILGGLGDWAKPWAMTGGLAALGFALWVPAALRAKAALTLVPLLAGLYAWLFDFRSIAGNLAFWGPALGALWFFHLRAETLVPGSGRREFLISTTMLSGTAAVALESYWRNHSIAQSANAPTYLFPMPAPPGAPGPYRKPVTQVGQFYVMSKNSVDPAIDPNRWRLRIKREGRTVREFSYRDLLSLPRQERYQTLRCISNTLNSDLMGTAYWSGVKLSQLCERREAGEGAVEAVVLGVDGHGDSFPVDYAFDDELMLAIGMNGETLHRNHGFPLRLLVPRYYGFKNIKWISEIDFVTKPYFGTWPRRGFSKEAYVHTASHIDRIIRGPGSVQVGGVSFAGNRGVQRVEARVDGGAWAAMQLEPALSVYTWTRWQGVLPASLNAQAVEVRALDGTGAWQLAREKPQFPDGGAGPTIRRIPS